MMKAIDLTGERFGKLTVIRRVEDRVLPSGRKATCWFCVCDCGGTKEVLTHSLTTGATTSCGCMAHSPTSYNWREFRAPDPITIQYRLVIGETYKIMGEKMKLLGLYNGFGRFEKETGMIECYHYWDLERML